ncbi:MAG: AsmA family protein [Halieaceae bacterium]|nr:AsmA family protein [Halieaceae bacterium]
MRRLFLTIAGLAFASIAALLWAARSESFVLDALHWTMATFTDLRLDLRNPHIDTYAGTLRADEIHLLPASGEGPALVSLLDVAATLSWGDWPRGPLLDSSLRAESLMIFVSEQGESAPPAPTQWLGYLDWLPGSLHLGQVHMITAAANTWIFPLKNVRGDRQRTGHYLASAGADYGGEPLDIALEILALQSGSNQAETSARITFNAPVSGSRVEVKGVLRGDSRDFQYDFALDAAYRDISEFLKGFEGGDNLAGSLQLNGRVVGDAAGFVLSGAHFVLDNMPEYGFEAGGELAYSWDGDSRIDLVANGELASVAYLVDWLELELPGLGRAQSSVQLRGSLDKPVIESFRLTTGSDTGLQLALSGRAIKLYEQDDDEADTHNTVFVDAQGPSLAVLQEWLGELPYDPGPWRASGLISGDQRAIAIDELVFETGAPESIQLRATGKVASILLPGDEQAALAASGIELQLQGVVPDSAQLVPLLGRDLPPYHRIRAGLALAGSLEELQLSDGSLAITGSDLALNADGVSAVLRPGREPPLSRLQAKLRLELSDTSALSQYTAARAPVLGPLQASAQLTQQGTRYQLRDILATVQSEGFSFEARGQLQDLTGLAEPTIEASASISDPDVLQTLTGLPLQPLDAELSVSSSAAGIHGLLRTEIGRNLLRTNAVIAFSEGAVHSLQVSLDTPHLYLQDLFNVRQNLVAAAGAPADAEQLEPMEQVRRSPPGFPIDAAVNIGGISGDNTHIDSMALRVTGIDHRYTLENFTISYGNALAELRGIVDIQARPAAISLAASATALPVAAILADVGVKSSASGALTILGGLTLTGDNAPELIANLNGSLALALENAVIEGAAYDLLATDLLAWIYSGAMAEESTHIDCTMAKFQFNQGVASTDSLYIESSKMIATGTAKFDLVNQTMDLRITPLSKSRTLQVPSEVRLRGEMSKPQASISPVNAVADAASAALMLIPELTMKLFGINKQATGSYRPCKAETGN